MYQLITGEPVGSWASGTASSSLTTISCYPNSVSALFPGCITWLCGSQSFTVAAILSPKSSFLVLPAEQSGASPLTDSVGYGASRGRREEISFSDVLFRVPSSLTGLPSILGPLWSQPCGQRDGILLLV